MKKAFLIITLLLALSPAATDASAQCSICTKTAAQMGEKPAKGLNTGILYLALTPFAVVGLVAWRWYKRNGSE